MNIQTDLDNAKSLFAWPEARPDITPEVNGWFTGASANVLKYFIHGLNPRFIAELGSWTGTGSTRFLLQAAPESHLLCFDHWSGDVSDHGNSGLTPYAEDDPELKQLPRIWDSFIYNTWEYRDRMTPIRNKTILGLESVKKYNFPVDLVFIDADHSFQGTYNDIMMCQQLWPDAQITGDDFTWESVKEAVIHAAKTLDMVVLYNHNCWWLTKDRAFEINF